MMRRWIASGVLASIAGASMAQEDCGQNVCSERRRYAFVRCTGILPRLRQMVGHLLSQRRRIGGESG